MHIGPCLIEREGLIRSRFACGKRRSFAGRRCPRRQSRTFKPQAQRRVARRTRFAPRAITTDPVRKFVAPRLGVSCLGNGRGRIGSRVELGRATASFSTLRTIHEDQTFTIVPIPVQRTTGSEPTGILAFFATLPRGQRRAKFTMPRPERTGTPSMDDLPSIFFR